MIRAIIRSTGAYLPEKILTNADLEKIVDTTDEWIVQRSGIKARHIAAENETTGDMAIKAAKNALDRANLSASDIDGVIVATTTPDRIFPSVAVKVQAELGVPPGPAFDIQAVCTGFVYALSIASAMIERGQVRRLLVIGAEKMSSIIDWSDRTTCVLFADGAACVILEAGQGDGIIKDRGLISTHLYANGAQRDLLYAERGGTLKMQGKEVFKYAVNYMASVVEEALEANNLKPGDIDWLVPHQANIRIIESTAEKLGVSMDKVIVTIDRHGNTSAASIPLALHEGVADGRIKPGQLVLMEAMGGGFTWGSGLVRF
jgi:3-oxoacyl-[acyl-carrier-protein] synthase-3